MAASDSQIADALAGVRGDVVITPRYTWRDKRWNDQGEITDAVRSCSIDWDTTRDVKRTAQMSLTGELLDIAPQLLAARLAGRWIGVEVDLTVPIPGSDPETVRYPMGLFRLSAHARVSQGENEHQTAEVIGLDPSVLLLESLGTPWSVAAGANYITEVVRVLVAVDLASRVDIEISTAVTPVAFTWPPNTPWITIINDLLQGINYWPIWFSGDGIARSTYRGNPEQDTFAIDAVYSDSEPVMPLGEPIPRETDTETYPNQVTVTIEAVSRTAAGRTARNDDGYPNGRNWIDEVISEKVIADTAQNATTALSELAVWYVVEARANCTQITLRTHPDPRRDPTRALREIAFVQLGVWFDGFGEEPERRYWHILAWTYDLSAPGQPMEFRLASLLPGTFVVGDPNGPGGSTVIDPL